MSTTPIDDLVLYRCPGCTRQFFSTAHDPMCPCGRQATLSECQDVGRAEHTMLDEMRALRRTIYMLVSAAGGRAEISFADMERAHAKGATLDCHYDMERQRQVWSIRESAPASVPLLK